jgi:hypothetical protein
MTSPTAVPPFITAGASIETNHDKGEGSVGCFARDRDGKPVMISCSHVLVPGFKIIDNMWVFSPNYSKCCSSGDRVGRPVFDRNQKAEDDTEGGWVGGYRDGQWTGGFNWIPAKVRRLGAVVNGHASETDCAMARVASGIKFQNVWRVPSGNSVITIPIRGAVTSGLGIGKGPNPGTAPTAEQYVRVFNHVNGKLRFGTMLSTPPPIPTVDDPDQIIFRFGISDSGDEAAGIKTSVNQFLILPRPSPVPGVSLADSYRSGEELTFEEGDSGSVVINHQNLVVGMIIRHGDPDRLLKLDRNILEFSSIRDFGVATPIRAVLDKLQVEIPAIDEGWSGTGPSAGEAVRVFGGWSPRDPALLAEQRGAERLRAGLRVSVRGRLLLGKIGQHRREVCRLLTSVRAIAVAWQELGGAAYFNHCVRGVRTPGHHIPTSINGVSRQRLMDAMMPLFARYASPRLRRDIERYGAIIALALLPVDTIEDVPAALASPGAST